MLLGLLKEWTKNKELTDPDFKVGYSMYISVKALDVCSAF